MAQTGKAAPPRSNLVQGSAGDDPASQPYRGERHSDCEKDDGPVQLCERRGNRSGIQIATAILICELTTES